jgi:alpha-tubulin suppressor-like RCC1 family protein/tRNA A-37 threonylcarbamoyl transferase component Bud32
MNAESAPAALDALTSDYEILRELGRGGTAVVYLARERATGDEVAIKLVRAQFADDSEAMARLAREARFVAQLHHPNVVAVRDVLDLGDAGLALVMTHVPGRTLRQILRDEGALASARASAILRDVALALDAAHAIGIIHRDVKPENVFVGDDDRAVLADFGIARSMSPETQQLTMQGVAIGTPAYMAPEQIDGDDLDARSDLYSLGLLGWEMLAGNRPFAGEALYSVLYHQKHVQVDDPRALRVEVPDALVSALAGAVEKERDARWSSIQEFLAALDGATAPRPWPASPVAGVGTMRVERAETPVPAESVVAIDWREAMSPAPEPVAGPSRRRLALGGVGALTALALVVAAVRIHSRDASRNDFRLESAGQIALSGNDAPKSVAMAPMSLAPPRDSTPPSDSALARSAASSTLPAAPMNTIVSRASAAPPVAPVVSSTGPPVARPAASTPAAVSRVRVSVGGRHSCLLADGRAFCWGGNDRGQLGTNSTTRLSAPLAPIGGASFTALTSGMSHSCGLSPEGTAWCWGDNDAGQLGDGTTSSRNTPTRVAGRHEFRAIAAGNAFGCALDTDDAAWCWGSDASGQLGDRASGSQVVPVRVAGGHRFTTLAAGWTFACALDGSDGAWCWGSNASGELGDSGTLNQRVPVLVRGGHAFNAISAGSAHACGIANDGSAWCWGSDSNGQLGDGSTGSRAVPVRVKSTVRFSTVAAGAVHSCALTSDGDAWCWGSNVYGQLGNDSNADSAVPVRVAGGHAFTALHAFGSHNCGITSAGETFCWGYNLDGQLGDGTRTHRSRPVYVQRPSAQ